MLCDDCRRSRSCEVKAEFLRRYFFRALGLHEEVACPDEEPIFYHGIDGVRPGRGKGP